MRGSRRRPRPCRGRRAALQPRSHRRVRLVFPVAQEDEVLVGQPAQGGSRSRDPLWRPRPGRSSSGFGHLVGGVRIGTLSVDLPDEDLAVGELLTGRPLSSQFRCRSRLFAGPEGRRPPAISTITRVSRWRPWDDDRPRAHPRSARRMVTELTRKRGVVGDDLDDEVGVFRAADRTLVRPSAAGAEVPVVESVPDDWSGWRS